MYYVFLPGWIFLKCHDRNGELYFVTINRDFSLADLLLRRCYQDKGRDVGRLGPGACLKVTGMGNELIIIGAFLEAGLLAGVVIPGMLVIWDRVLWTTWRIREPGSESKPEVSGAGFLRAVMAEGCSSRIFSIFLQGIFWDI